MIHRGLKWFKILSHFGFEKPNSKPAIASYPPDLDLCNLSVLVANFTVLDRPKDGTTYKHLLPLMLIEKCYVNTWKNT